MSKRQVIMILGVLVAIFLFLGFPFFWDKIISVLFGVCIILLAYSIKIDNDQSKTKSTETNNSESSQTPYVDHRGQGESKTINNDPVNTV